MLTLARAPRDNERAVLIEGVQRYRELYKQDPAAAQALLAIGATPVQDTIPPAELAAWTMIANTILNLDETITRP
jgi:hypothetical protein